MNFVKLYIGDYLRDTGTLTLAQHGAYMLMLLEHYANEKPLPKGRDLYRLLRAESKAERDAIDFVAAKFWAETDAGYSNDRAIREIERAAHQRTVNQEIGKRGGRPKGTEQKTESVCETKPNRNPNQTPDTREIQTPPTPGGVAPPRPRAVRKCPESFEVTADLADWAAREVPAVNANSETAKFRDHTFKTAISDWPAAWRNWLRKAAEFGPKGVVRHESFKERDARAAAERYAVLTGGLAHDKKAVAPLPFERGYSETIEVIPNEQRQIAG